MSTLRRRFLGSDTPEYSREPTPDKNEEVQLVTASRLKELKNLTRHKHGSRRRAWLLFLLGGVLGLFGAAFFANQQDVINLQGLAELNLESLLDVIPAGIIKDARELTVSVVTTYRLCGVDPWDRNMSATPSITTHSLWACTCKPRVSRPPIQ